MAMVPASAWLLELIAGVQDIACHSPGRAAACVRSVVRNVGKAAQQVEQGRKSITGMA